MTPHIRKYLSRTWSTFFFRFSRPTKIQELAIPVIAQGRDALLVSPAATGKTEAALAPLTERYCMDPATRGQLSIIYVAPTRALVNNIFGRFKEVLSETGLRLAIKTGDSPNLSAKRPPDILITTPESLDSMLGRKKSILRNVKAVILDEIHLLDNSYRGDQLIVLLRRLKAQGVDFQLVAMSATVPDPGGIAKRYFSELPKILINEQVRPIKLRLTGSEEETVNLLKKQGWFKVVWFCNSRRMVETVATSLKKDLWRSDRVFVHHASLPKVRRLEVESALQNLQTGICVATTTLELGIDIGDVDAVVLQEPPLDVSSYGQRTGRGCRRKEGMTAVGIVSNETDTDAFNELNRMANNGVLSSEPYIADPSVAVQQIFSILFERPVGVTVSGMGNLVQGIVNSSELDDILEQLAKEEWIVPGPGGRIMATTKLMDFAVRGKIHSNIPDFGTWSLIDVRTSRSVGRIDAMASPGRIITVGGMMWKIRSMNTKQWQLFVSRVPKGAIVTAFKFRPGFGAFYSYLPDSVKQSLAKRVDTTFTE